MKYFCLTSISVILFITNLLAQTPTPQDCLGAIPICNDVYDEPDPYAYSGNGNYENEIMKFQDCITSENNGIWYRFTAQSNGYLNFTISPHHETDDYDWIVFDFTNGTCADLAINTQEYVISSNNYGSENNNGPTGASSKMSGGTAGDCNGPGDTNGPKWNDDIDVKEGRTYLLYLSNYTGSTHGYKIDFSESTAKIYDNSAPHINRIVDASPGAKKLIFEFSEYVDCSSVDETSFELVSGGNNIPVKSISGDECKLGGKNGKRFTILTNDALIPGNYTLKCVGNVNDACNNVSDNNKLDFEIEDINITSTTFSGYSCVGTSNGKITINANCASADLYYSVDGGESYYDNDGKFTDLPPGEYKIMVKTLSGYTKAGKNISISAAPEILIDSVLFANIFPCPGDDNGSAKMIAHGGEGDLRFSIDNGESFNKTGRFEYLKAGQYEITVQDENQCAKSSGKFQITQPPLLDIEAIGEGISCYGESDGIITFTKPLYVESLQYSIDGGSNFETAKIQFENLQAGDYKLFVKDTLGCLSETQIVSINEPEPLEIISVETKDIPKGFEGRGGEITVDAKGGTGSLEYILDFAQIQSSNEFTGVSLGEHYITVIDENNCPSIDTAFVSIQLRYFIEILKAFTPNSDGINDVWKIKFIDLYPDASVKVFDRWNRLVYESDNGIVEWDGTYKGKKLSMDSYFYIIDLKDGKEKKIGYFTLIR